MAYIDLFSLFKNKLHDNFIMPIEIEISKLNIVSEISVTIDSCKDNQDNDCVIITFYFIKMSNDEGFILTYNLFDSADSSNLGDASMIVHSDIFKGITGSDGVVSYPPREIIFDETNMNDLLCLFQSDLVISILLLKEYILDHGNKSI